MTEMEVPCMIACMPNKVSHLACFPHARTIKRAVSEKYLLRHIIETLIISITIVDMYIATVHEHLQNVLFPIDRAMRELSPTGLIQLKQLFIKSCTSGPSQHHQLGLISDIVAYLDDIIKHVVNKEHK